MRAKLLVALLAAGAVAGIAPGAAAADFGGCPAGYDILGVDQTSLLEPADIDGDTHICTKYSVRGITYYALDDIDPATASSSCRPHFGPASAGTTYIADDHNGNGVICSRMIYLDTGGVQVGGGINNAVLLIHDDSEGRDVH